MQREQGREAAQRERASERLEPTVAALLVEYWEREARHLKSGPELRRLLEKDVLPAWGKRKVKNITRRDAVELLDHIRDRARSGNSAYVFPSPRPNGRDQAVRVHTLARALNRKFASLPATIAAGNSTAPPALVERLSAARVAAFTPHDLRRTLRTRLSALGVDPLVAEKVLGHQLQGIARIYDRHDYGREKRAALLTWERHLYRLAGLVKPAPAKVIPIRRTGRTVARETA